LAAMSDASCFSIGFQREQQRAEEAEQQTRQTTLSEYLEACHELVFTKFVVETDKSLTL
jgi:hypothetical protein